jgi:Cu(I)/Ag(I) efflux system membrane fusion protein
MIRTPMLALAVAGLVAAGGAGFLAGRISGPAPTPRSAAPAARQTLYWYDPMYPAQHFDRAGKSPYMDMPLQPKYADQGPAEAGVQIDPARVENLGVRLAPVARGLLPGGVAAAGTLAFDARDLTVVQARATGFVQRVYGRAPGDVVRAGAPLADLLIPDWAGAQGEYLAVRRTGDAALIGAARQRLELLGMPAALIAAVERTGQARNVVTVATPAGGVIRTLGVRSGMAVAPGQTLAEVNGLSVVWLEAAIPEAMAGAARVGQPAAATLAAFPGETFNGRVTALLPQAQADTHTLTARIELANPRGRLRPGMFATVQLGDEPKPALLVPSEAVIRTGRRTLVMLARPGGRFLPAEIRVGREAGGRTEVLAGLAEGDQVVASGQFLLDSEASLSGLQPQPIAAAPR